MISCPKCEEDIEESSIQCIYCGYHFDKKENSKVSGSTGVFQALELLVWIPSLVLSYYAFNYISSYFPTGSSIAFAIWVVFSLIVIILYPMIASLIVGLINSESGERVERVGRVISNNALVLLIWMVPGLVLSHYIFMNISGVFAVVVFILYAVIVIYINETYGTVHYY